MINMDLSDKTAHLFLLMDMPPTSLENNLTAENCHLVKAATEG